MSPLHVWLMSSTCNSDTEFEGAEFGHIVGPKSHQCNAIKFLDCFECCMGIGQNLQPKRRFDFASLEEDWYLGSYMFDHWSMLSTPNKKTTMNYLWLKRVTLSFNLGPTILPFFHHNTTLVCWFNAFLEQIFPRKIHVQWRLPAHQWASVAGPAVLPESAATTAAPGGLHGSAAQPSLPRKGDVGVPRWNLVHGALFFWNEGMIWGLNLKVRNGEYIIHAGPGI